MLSFKFKAKPTPSQRQSNRKIVLHNASGVIVPSTLPNRYDVKVKLSLTQKKDLHLPLVNDLVIPLTEDSYSCKGKPDIWIKSEESMTGWVHIIRNESVVNMQDCPSPYIPFRPGFIARGKIVKVEGVIQFRLIRCVCESQLIEVNSHINALLSNDCIEY